MLLAMSLALVEEPSRVIPEGVTTPDPVMWGGCSLQFSYDQVPSLNTDLIPPLALLVLDGTPIFAQEFLAPGTGDILATLPGYARGSLSGFPLSDATVMVDGVRFDVGGRVAR